MPKVLAERKPLHRLAAPSAPPWLLPYVSEVTTNLSMYHQREETSFLKGKYLTITKWYLLVVLNLFLIVSSDTRANLVDTAVASSMFGQFQYSHDIVISMLENGNLS